MPICSNCDLHLAGDNLTKIVAGFCRVLLVMKDNDERMWSITDRQNIGSREAAMLTSRFKRIALAQLSLSGCAGMFGVCVLIEHAQAQPGYVPPPTPLPPPVLNPSSPNTVPQPSYRPITPTTPSTASSPPSTVLKFRFFLEDPHKDR